MNVCVCCESYGDATGDARCIRCKHTAVDNFKASDKCATCNYDPRYSGICVRCIDFDKYDEHKLSVQGSLPCGDG